jgi:hypothetical protein
MELHRFDKLFGCQMTVCGNDLNESSQPLDVTPVVVTNMTSSFAVTLFPQRKSNYSVQERTRPQLHNFVLIKVGVLSDTELWFACGSKLDTV